MIEVVGLSKLSWGNAAKVKYFGLLSLRVLVQSNTLNLLSAASNAITSHLN